MKGKHFPHLSAMLENGLFLFFFPFIFETTAKLQYSLFLFFLKTLLYALLALVQIHDNFFINYCSIYFTFSLNIVPCILQVYHIFSEFPLAEYPRIQRQILFGMSSSAHQIHYVSIPLMFR